VVNTERRVSLHRWLALLGSVFVSIACTGPSHTVPSEPLASETGSKSDSSPGDKVTISVLAAPATADDELPAGFADTPQAERMGDLAGARRVAVRERGQVYVVPGSGETVCIVVVAGSRERLVSAGSCGRLIDVATNGIFLVQGQPGVDVEVVLLVPDGVTRVEADGRSYDVDKNIAFVSASESVELVFVGGTFDRSVITIPIAEVDPDRIILPSSSLSSALVRPGVDLLEERSRRELQGFEVEPPRVLWRLACASGFARSLA
jgi:hypothetical protein